MKIILTLILLQIGLFKSKEVPVTDAKIYIEDAKSHEQIAMFKTGQSGNFQFSNLDPGVYNLSIEIPENSVKELDKRTRSKYDTNILVAYNKSKKTFCWQRKDGYLFLNLSKPIKMADLNQPLFETEEMRELAIDEAELQKRKTTFFERLMMANRERDITSKITIMQLTVANQFGSFSGTLRSVSQRDYYKMVVGTDKISLEDQNAIQVIIKEK